MATTLYELSASQGNMPAVFNLAVSFERGEGVPRDVSRSARIYAVASVKGHAGSLCNLGVLFRRGIGVPQDLERAVALYELSTVTEAVLRRIESGSSPEVPQQT